MPRTAAADFPPSGLPGLRSKATVAFPGDSFQKSTVSVLRGVAPDMRFWQGPADLRPPFGQGRLPFYAPAALAGKAWGDTSI
jgi:hypothetical protein